MMTSQFTKGSLSQTKYMSGVETSLFKEEIARKLVLGNGVIQLPNPETIPQWEVDPVNFPTISGDNIESYFNDVNKEIGIEAKERKAIRLGKGLALSGHVLDVQYTGIN